MDITSIDYRTPAALGESSKRVKALAEAFETHRASNDAQLKIEDANSDVSMGKEAHGCWPYESSWFRQFYLLYARSLKQTLRDRIALGIRFFTTLLFALILGGVYSETTLGQKVPPDILFCVYDS